MLNASLVPLVDIQFDSNYQHFLVNGPGIEEEQEIEQSSRNDNINDWLEEALPAMREGSTGKPFRSKYWGLLYFSAPTLLKYAGELGSFDPMNGAVVFLKLHFTNDLWHWWKWFDPSGDEVRLFITLESGSESKTMFRPFRSHELGRSAWNRGGLNVAVKVTSKIKVWNWTRTGSGQQP